ncbi:hypothetical protein JAO29_16540 [Edaphobacter sp. HDX4]|uniref:hypothetical protein n=1 Tax=Edaphobacter sp. HDX4 TaxID=2794064 RepID=UPI002FE618F9
MPEASEIETLRSVIAEDEKTVKSLEKEETEITGHVPVQGFEAATTRERVMSQARVIEDRLYKNRKRLTALEQQLRNAAESSSR